jgi:hypothetical protein
MWHTQSGDRVLVAKEKSLFVHATACFLDYLLDQAEASDTAPEEICPTGVDLFDRMDAANRVCLLGEITRALIDPAEPMPELTAATEAAVYAVFRFILSEIESEVDFESEGVEREPDLEASDFILGEDPFYWRKLTLATYFECQEPHDFNEEDDDDEDLDAASVDLSAWENKLECLADRILWDRDWEIEEIMDAPPKLAREVKEWAGIDPEYFVATPNQPTEDQVQSAAALIRRLADHDMGDRERSTVTLRYNDDGIVGVAFGDPDLDSRYGIVPDGEIECEATVDMPVLVAVDASKMLRKIDEGRQKGKLTEALRADARLNDALHHYLPEGLQKRFRRTFKIAEGILAERDYGGSSAEFDVAEFANVQLDEKTREQLESRTEGLVMFLCNLSADRNYEFTDEALRKALIKTADELVQEFINVDDSRVMD